MLKTKKLPLWSMSLLITGNVLGVGILILPIRTGLSGYWPTLVAIIGIWAMMCFTALIIAKRIHPSPDGKNTFDIPSFFRKHLGPWGHWLAVATNLILLYGLLTIYLSMVAATINGIFPSSLSGSTLVLIYFMMASSLVVFGIKYLRRSNAILIASLAVLFILLLFYATKTFSVSRLVHQNWLLLPVGLPIIVSAFHFHNIVPTVCHQLNYEYKHIRRAILQGTIIGLILNIIWATIVIGGLPGIQQVHTSIYYAYQHGEPAITPLTLALHSKIFVIVGSAFALLSITAAYMANSKGLMGFFRDLTNTYLKTTYTPLVALLTFLPPLLITLYDPNLFLKALNVIGGIGEVVLFGTLPAIVLLKYIYQGKGESKRLIIPAYIVLFLSCLILIVAIKQQFQFF